MDAAAFSFMDAAVSGLIDAVASERFHLDVWCGYVTMDKTGVMFMWMIAAVFSAFFAGITAILAKCGIRKTDSDVATAVRTVVVLLFSWLMVLVSGSCQTLGDIDRRSFVFLILSGIATGASWICYFKALSVGNVNKVVPIDKSSTVLSVLMAIFIFHETNHLAFKLIGTVLIGSGVFLMIEKSTSEKETASKGWMLYAVMSAVFAALTTIFAKIGITGVESNAGTAIRTCVVLIMAWLIVLSKGKWRQVRTVDHREMLFICLSGVATGASWLCYYYAVQNGIVSIVVPIDKLSIVVSIMFSYLVFHEKLSKGHCSACY